MFTKLYLLIRDLPAWLRRARRENPWLFAEWWLGFVAPGGVVLNFFTFRSDAAYLSFLVAFPAVWAVLSSVFSLRTGRVGDPFGAKAMRSLPVGSALAADAVGMMAIVYARGAFGSDAYLEFYLLLAATLVRIGLWASLRSRAYRGKAFFDVLAWILSLALSVALYALSITA